MQHTRSKALFDRASQFIPGGVNSPVRAFKSVGGTPVFFKKANGAILTDEDDNEYIDFIASWGPMIMGHAFKPVIKAIQQKVKDSTSFGAPTALEVQMAELIQSMVPGVDKLRMVNSGTEACMSAIRLARGYTGRDKVLKFRGNYHGHGDSFLIQAGSGAVTMGSPNSPGVTANTARDTLLADYNNLPQVRRVVNAYRGAVAAIIVEPVAGNMGCVPPAEGFLAGLRQVCDEEGIVLVFDEVMTGFRLAPGGVQERMGITADLVCLGKVIGAGMPVGAYGGKQAIMDCVSPVGPVYQAGTLSGNPIAMISGYTLLSYLNEKREVYARLDKKGAKLAKGLDQVLADSGLPYQINQIGSMISVHFTDEPVTDFASAAKGDNDHFKQFFHGMLNRGMYLPPSAYESWFLSDAITYPMIDQAVAAAGETLAEMTKK
jgi:glutamate-1-semialdehyde 2,1-aminomutase